MENGDYFLLMTDALAHFFLSQRRLCAPTSPLTGLDQASFADLVARRAASASAATTT
ncbi:MAG: hypothetical protein U0703_25785 [Anaerolineae bacterium]